MKEKKYKLKKKDNRRIWRGTNGITIILPKEYKFGEKIKITGIIKV